MEPFYQLQQPEGATAENSILLDYATSFFIITPFKALRRRHYVVFASSIISMGIMTLAPLSSETFFVSLSGNCGYISTGNCYATWGIYTLLARTIEGILALIIVLTTFLIILGVHRNSGVFADPLSIAGLTTLSGRPETLRKFRAIDSMASNAKLKSELASLKFKFAMDLRDNDLCYGISIIEGVNEKNLGKILAKSSSETVLLPEHTLLHQLGERSLSFRSSVMSFIELHDDLDHIGKMSPNNEERAITTNEARKANTTSGLAESTTRMEIRRYTTINSENIRALESTGAGRKAIANRILYIGAFTSLGGFIATIMYYRLNRVENAFSRYIDSRGFGVRLIMTIIGVLVKLFFESVDKGKLVFCNPSQPAILTKIYQGFRKLEPYRRLIAGPSSSDDSILVPIWVSPYSAVLPALRRRHFLLALMAFAAILSEFLPILLANVPASTAVTLQARVVCTWLSVAILTLMLVCAFCLMLRRSSALHLLPRQPDNIASMLRYTIGPERTRGSSMVDSFTGLAFVSGKRRDDLVRKEGKRYQLGWTLMEAELCIDEDVCMQQFRQ